ncbi:MAG: hypothetical protein QM779_08250 [Propionicimonas sp.]
MPARIAQGVREGTITLAFRRWEQPRVRVGGTQLTTAGIVRFEAVEEVLDPGDLTEDDAGAAGFADLAALRRQLYPVAAGGAPSAPGEHGGLAPRRAGPRASKGGDHVYRVQLAWVGEDPRVALRADVPDAEDLNTLTAAVAKLDAGRRSGPWTRPILEWIRDHPGVISTELAALLGREVAPMKADIRRLKALGLTESLRVGYRLSPRGVAYLESLE